jgi:DNA-binding Xre family transcriptional regulator
MFTDECLKYVDVETLCEVLEIDVEDILNRFQDRIDDHLEELKELFDNE